MACEIAVVAKRVDERFGQAVSFFTLRRLHDLRLVMRALARVAFCEPNGFNPLFDLQILVTPGMTWRGDGGASKMRPRVASEEVKGKR